MRFVRSDHTSQQPVNWLWMVCGECGSTDQLFAPNWFSDYVSLVTPLTYMGFISGALPSVKRLNLKHFPSGSVSDPIVTGVRPAPDDEEPFMLRQRTDEIADYDKGFACGQSGGQNDDKKSQAWQRGWAETQE